MFLKVSNSLIFPNSNHNSYTIKIIILLAMNAQRYIVKMMNINRLEMEKGFFVNL